MCSVGNLLSTVAGTQRLNTLTRDSMFKLSVPSAGTKRSGDPSFPRWNIAPTTFVTDPRLCIAKFVGVHEQRESHREFLDGVRARHLSLLCASVDFGDSEVFGFKWEARLYTVIGGLGGVVSTSACLYQLSPLWDVLALPFRQRFVIDGAAHSACSRSCGRAPACCC